MGYSLWRDNSDIADSPDVANIDARTEIYTLSEMIDTSSQRGRHADMCGNPEHDEKCPSWPYLEAGSEETIAWLVAKGVLTMSMVREALTRYPQ